MRLQRELAWVAFFHLVFLFWFFCVCEIWRAFSLPTDVLLLKEKQKRCTFTLILPSFPQKSYYSCHTASSLVYTAWNFIVNRKVTAGVLQKKTLQSTEFSTFPYRLNIYRWFYLDNERALSLKFVRNCLAVNKMYKHVSAIINYSRIHYRCLLYHRSCVKINFFFFFLHQVSRTDFFHTNNPASAKRKIEIRLQAEMHPVISIRIVYLTVILLMEFPPLDSFQYATQYSR